MRLNVKNSIFKRHISLFLVCLVFIASLTANSTVLKPGMIVPYVYKEVSIQRVLSVRNFATYDSKNKSASGYVEVDVLAQGNLCTSDPMTIGVYQSYNSAGEYELTLMAGQVFSSNGDDYVCQGFGLSVPVTFRLLVSEWILEDAYQRRLALIYDRDTKGDSRRVEIMFLFDKDKNISTELVFNKKPVPSPTIIK